MMIMCLIWFVCMYSCEHTYLPPQRVLDPERLIVRTEMRSRPYLVLVETQSYFIISWFHALGSLANLLNLQGPWCREALIHAGDGRGQNASESEDGWMERYLTYFCNFLRLFLLLFFITAAHFLNQQPENDLSLPMHLLNLIISELRDI